MTKTLLLLANGFEAVEASVFTDVFGWNQLEGDGTTELITVGLHPQLKCTWNFTVTPEFLVSEVNLDDFDALVIPGGFEEAGFYSDAFDARFSKIIRHFNDNNKLIATICVASLALGNSGILKGRKATTYNHSTSIRRRQLANFGANLVNAPIVVDNNIITSSNPGTAFEVAFLALERLTSKENCHKVRELMGF
ncbi:dimethyladenosine transferase [Brochothrix thermosphacta]|uniref:DJ-1/PfpI family protein n=1 Tax=Brochothrix thermosphacta TaxID=2756 RepID=UPI00083FC010|nr:DJ-1/PfpI family protein [Brochothrix thermosphacta]ODJ50038.1 dimethyladenosine transferase [Brochothrix thermosphacta]ODJ61915.1 dimethyladenosine transferase [Brochothrix thermosphacta]